MYEIPAIRQIPGLPFEGCSMESKEHFALIGYVAELAGDEECVA